MLVVQGFDGVAVEDADCFAEKVNCKHSLEGEEQRQQKEEENPRGEPQISSGHLGCLLLYTVGAIYHTFMTCFADRIPAITHNGRKELHQKNQFLRLRGR